MPSSLIVSVQHQSSRVQRITNGILGLARHRLYAEVCQFHQLSFDRQRFNRLTVIDVIGDHLQFLLSAFGQRKVLGFKRMVNAGIGFICHSRIVLRNTCRFLIGCTSVPLPIRRFNTDLNRFIRIIPVKCYAINLDLPRQHITSIGTCNNRIASHLCQQVHRQIAFLSLIMDMCNLT